MSYLSLFKISKYQEGKQKVSDTHQLFISQFFIAYEQMYVRTMFFDKTNPEVPFKIDGVDYWITGAGQNDMWGCKEAIV